MGRRAIELALSGKFVDLASIRSQLQREEFQYATIRSSSLRRMLLAIIAEKQTARKKTSVFKSR